MERFGESAITPEGPQGAQRCGKRRKSPACAGLWAGAPMRAGVGRARLSGVRFERGRSGGAHGRPVAGAGGAGANRRRLRCLRARGRDSPARGLSAGATLRRVA